MAYKDFEKKAFNYTVAGMADEVGIIARGSAANPKTTGLNSKKEKEKSLLRVLEQFQEWQQKFLERIDECINDLDKRINAAQKLLQLLREGERDFKADEHHKLIGDAMLTKEQLLILDTESMELYINMLDVGKSQLEALKEEVKNVDLSNPEVMEKLLQKENTLNEAITHSINPETILEIQRLRGFSQDTNFEMQKEIIFLNESDNLDSFFDTGNPSDDIIATTVTTTMDVKSDFNEAGTPLQEVAEVETSLNTKPVFQHKPNMP